MDKPAPPVDAATYSLTARTRSTAFAGIATGLLRLYRSSEAECDQGQQQNCSNALHKFSPKVCVVIVTPIAVRSARRIALEIAG